MLYKLSEEELRSICRKNIESLEKWARNIIDMRLKKAHGDNYFYKILENGEPLFKKSITEKAEKMLVENSQIFSRPIDTLYLDEIIYVLCKKKLYNENFKEFLKIMYPNGAEEVRTFLKRLIPIRNKLSHANPLSIREAEQCICYCNDFIDGVKQYYNQIGVERVYNVPNAIKLTDSLGRSYDLNKDISFESIFIGDGKDYNNLHSFELGDKYVAWLDLDPSFSEDDYIFNWHIECGDTVSTKSKLELEITENLIREKLAIYCTIKSKKNWHRYNGYDQQFAIVFQVLPPRD